MARSNLIKQCPDLHSKSIEMVCADYLEGLKQARARYCPSCNVSISSTHIKHIRSAQIAADNACSGQVIA